MIDGIFDVWVRWKKEKRVEKKSEKKKRMRSGVAETADIFYV